LLELSGTMSYSTLITDPGLLVTLLLRSRIA